MSDNANNKISFNTDSKELILEQKKMGLGYLGRFFGDSKSAANNITGAVILILVLPIPILCFFSSNITPLDYIKVVVPTIGPIAGYFFGKNS